MTQREQWRHPVTQELAEVELHPGVARRLRHGTVEERRHSPTWEQEGRQMIARHQAIDRQHQRIWQELGLPLLSPLEDDLQDTPSVTSFQISIPLDDPRAQSIFQAFEHALESPPDPIDFENITVSPPRDRELLHALTSELREEGFVRQVTRQPDGSLWLPEELEPWRVQLEASEQPVLRLRGDVQGLPRRWGSKLGGVPYRPLGAPWPITKKGDYPLSFLAQLNFAELNPGGQHLPDFPSEGLLQFFVLDDMFYGAEDEPWMALNGAQTFYRVLYWPSVIEDEQLLEAETVPLPTQAPWEGSPDIGEELPFDPDRETGLIGLPDREPVTGSDRFKSRWLGVDPGEVRLADGVTTLSSELYTLSAYGHKLGGYPDFTQADQRKEEDDDLILLFQLDTDREMGVMWGDAGIARFFIRRSDLLARDFSRVAYDWDCG